MKNVFFQLFGHPFDREKRIKNHSKYRFLILIDLAICVAWMFFVLVSHPSFDNMLAKRTVALQMVIGISFIFGARILGGVYSSNHKLNLEAFVGCALSDICALLMCVVIQRLLYRDDRIEALTISVIVIGNLIGALSVRYIFYLLTVRPIKLKEAIPFSPPDISELEIQEVTEALRSGWITTGPRTKKLENLIASYLDVPRCACLNSQTAAAEMSLRVLGIGPGDEVITCAYTYTATASVIDHVGAKIVLVDCSADTDSIHIDYDALENAITEKTKAIISIDLGGIPCDYDRIFDIVNRKKSLFVPNNDIQMALGRVAVVADAAHAFGASWKGHKVGAIADFTNFSFHAVKNFTTGEGGAVSWRHIDGVDDEAIYKRIMLYSLHGQSKDALAKSAKGGWEYDILGPWYKCNMTDIAAAIGLAQLERYPGLLKRRRKIAERYDAALKGTGILTLAHYTDEYQSSGHLYITRIPGITAEQRNEIIRKMADKKVTCNVHYKPLPLLTAYKKMGFRIDDYPNAEAVFSNEITLPLYSTLTDKNVDYIAKTYKGIVKEYVS